MTRTPYALSMLLALPVSLQATELELTLTSVDGPVSGAVVYLDGGPSPASVTAEIAQQDRQFHPRVLVIPVNSTVDFPNRDNTQHHVYSFSPAKTFELELYTDRPETPVIFDQPGIVELGCNIHDHMQAFVVVVDTTAAEQTNGKGQIQLSVPTDTKNDGTISINIWHPRLVDNTRPVRQTVNPDLPARVSIELTPEPDTDSPLDRLQKRFRDI
ncbi:methylamine utilization protein [Marinobacter halophilus]|uniref:Methylamine utilization protein n=1 Tax=Marinobacter halophilus TaxID=1323740 RepID=A0A2T1KJZ9_9GAMM|nr:methylamine utilization protein [Marinobacter halophilus]PSF10023.1 methylamine utilization protein [Marinobacter halophilus]GGC67053.1 hypothetical protein GCM10011362_14460 [Marinobacter halophilus]